MPALGSTPVADRGATPNSWALTNESTSPVTVSSTYHDIIRLSISPGPSNRRSSSRRLASADPSGAIRFPKATSLAIVDFPVPIGPRRRRLRAIGATQNSRIRARSSVAASLLPGSSASRSSAITSCPGDPIISPSTSMESQRTREHRRNAHRARSAEHLPHLPPSGPIRRDDGVSLDDHRGTAQAFQLRDRAFELGNLAVDHLVREHDGISGIGAKFEDDIHVLLR